MKMKINFKTLSIGTVLVLAMGFYAFAPSPSLKKEVEKPQVEILATSSAESLFALPPIGAVGPSGPQDCFDKGTFVDFMWLTPPTQVPQGHEVRWSSTPQLPGLTPNTGVNILNTYYIPSWVTPGCYLITAEEWNSNGLVDFKSVMIRIKAFPSDPCEPCDGAPGGGGSGGGCTSGPACDPVNPTSTGGGDGAA